MFTRSVFQNKESSIWRQNDHAKIVGAFHLSRRVSDENRACSISIRFFKIKDPFDGRSFLMCSHDPFFGTNTNRILKNGSCERALRSRLLIHRPTFYLGGPPHVMCETVQKPDCRIVHLYLFDQINCYICQVGISFNPGRTLPKNKRGRGVVR